MEGIRAFRLCHNMVSDINPDRTPNQGILGFPADHDGRSRTRDRASVFASSSPCESLPLKRHFHSGGSVACCSLLRQQLPLAGDICTIHQLCEPVLFFLSVYQAEQRSQQRTAMHIVATGIGVGQQS